MKNFPSLWQTSQQNPFRAMARWQNQMDQLFADLMSKGSVSIPEAATFQPPCDVEETDSHYMLSFDLPGMRKQDIRVEFADGHLRIAGERKDEREKGTGDRYRSEKFYGVIERIIALPQNVKSSEIEAHFENGVLHVALPKAALIQPRQVPVVDQKGGIFSKLLSRKEEKPREKVA